MDRARSSGKNFSSLSPVNILFNSDVPGVKRALRGIHYDAISRKTLDAASITFICLNNVGFVSINLTGQIFAVFPISACKRTQNNSRSSLNSD